METREPKGATSSDRTRAGGLSEEEVRRRRAATIATVANASIEGLCILPETLEIMDAYDRGEIEADEMVNRIRERHVPGRRRGSLAPGASGPGTGCDQGRRAEEP